MKRVIYWALLTQMVVDYYLIIPPIWFERRQEFELRAFHPRTPKITCSRRETFITCMVKFRRSQVNFALFWFLLSRLSARLSSRMGQLEIPWNYDLRCGKWCDISDTAGPAIGAHDRKKTFGKIWDIEIRVLNSYYVRKSVMPHLLSIHYLNDGKDGAVWCFPEVIISWRTRGKGRLDDFLAEFARGENKGTTTVLKVATKLPSIIHTGLIITVGPLEK